MNVNLVICELQKRKKMSYGVALLISYRLHSYLKEENLIMLLTKLWFTYEPRFGHFIGSSAFRFLTV